ncbi:Hypothetical protein R9X50_00164000 [Acrodontium crateriforme]|uniref:Uncharacterized protein n=1 Tax=Acrodontium crateriforme TaxID=150365 RepID=A0AAQ3RA83_9PEZI|nr:Hypothetical protein R9X50_00164000 [Acrodontium crateriforme]
MQILICGPLDIAVNCAGIAGGYATDENMLDDWRRIPSVNLDGVWLCQRAEIQQMLTQESLDPAPRGNRGVIVNVASILGFIGGSPDTAAVAYTSSKHGVMGMTRTDAIMYTPRGIRINAICLGYIDTPMLGNVEVQHIIADEVKKCPQHWGRWRKLLTVLLS